MSAVENKMNTEMNTPVVVVEEKKKVKLVKSKKTDAPATKPAAKLVMEDEVVENSSVGNSSVVAEPVMNPLVAEMVTAIVVDVVDNVVNEVDDAAEYDAMVREKVELELKIRMFEEQKKVRKNIAEYRDIIKLNRRVKLMEIRKQIEDLQEEIHTIQTEQQAINELDDNELTSTILGDDKLMEELKIVKKDHLEEMKAKPAAKKTAAPKEEGTGRRPAVAIKTMKPADRWALIKVGTQFRAKQKDFIKYYKKTAAGVVECNKQGGLLVGAPIYAGNQEAANAFKVDAGIPYSISGWEFLHIYNPATDKAKSLKKWNGELEYLNW